MSQEGYTVSTKESFTDLRWYLMCQSPHYLLEGNTLTTEDAIFEIDQNLNDQLGLLDYNKFNNKLVYGKNQTLGIVCVEYKPELNQAWLFLVDGSIKKIQHKPFILSSRSSSHSKRLSGNQYFKYLETYDDKNVFFGKTSSYRKSNTDFWTLYNFNESAMVFNGITTFKGLTLDDIKVQSFDIETNGTKKDTNSIIYLITNSVQHKGVITRKHFRLDSYENSGELLKDWVKYTQDVNADIMVGHNIFGFDFPYIRNVADNYGVSLDIGRDLSPIEFNEKESAYRVDGNQEWSYNKLSIFGRHVIDTMFLAVKYDVARNYPSWKLKEIIEYEGMVKEGRQFYDASQIAKNWANLEEREKIVEYGKDDSDDSLNLFYKMIPSFFYMAQSVSKNFQDMMLGATGGWVNSMMVRSYLQDGHSIPKADQPQRVAGGMSYGIPGVYTNVVKYDAASYYPSTILAFDIYNPEKDPNANFLELVRFFTKKRLVEKKQAKDTGLQYWDDLQGSSKILINSAYGALGTSGLNYNSFEHAKLITACCRAGLQKAIIWATGKKSTDWWSEYNEEQDFTDFSYIDSKTKIKASNMDRYSYKLVNLDTDSLSFAKEDGSVFTELELDTIYKGINDIMYCNWEDDGYFPKVVVVKAKNYILVDDKGKKKIKGSSLKDSKKEKALLELINKLISHYVDGYSNPTEIYESYIAEAVNIKDIDRWVIKKSITEKLLCGTRTNETKVLDALQGTEFKEGDKVFLYNAIGEMIQKYEKGQPTYYKDGRPKMVLSTPLKLKQQFNNDADAMHYVARVYDTMDIWSNIVDMSQITNYSLSKNKTLLDKYRK